MSFLGAAVARVLWFTGSNLADLFDPSYIKLRKRLLFTDKFVLKNDLVSPGTFKPSYLGGK